MSIGGSLASALSGLAAAARSAEIVASNVANARTEGFGRREAVLGARSIGTTGQGVAVTGVLRHTDAALLSERRIAGAAAAGAELRADALARIGEAVGLPGTPYGIADRIAGLEAALLAAAGQPEGEARLAAVLAAARGLAGQLGAASAEVQTARTEADRAIAADVATLNDTLARIAAMNGQIRTTIAGGRDASALIDQRQALVDRIAAIVPLREVAQEFGQIALYTTAGAVLLDGRPATLGFQPAGIVVPQMTLAGGALSGLTINGRAVATAGEYSPIAGGRIAALFAIRDSDAPAAQARLDALARDLVERLAAPGLDPTLAPGAAGLLTDSGGPFDAADETGLAGRLRVNPAADPAAGGALWRLRDGLGAAAPGLPGASALLAALAGALEAPREPASGGFLPGARSAAGLAGELVAGLAGERLAREADAGFAATRADALRQLELEGGVDLDRELQLLLLIERAYAANARVIQIADRMLESLLGI